MVSQHLSIQFTDPVLPSKPFQENFTAYFYTKGKFMLWKLVGKFKFP